MSSSKEKAHDEALNPWVEDDEGGKHKDEDMTLAVPAGERHLNESDDASFDHVEDLKPSPTPEKVSRRRKVKQHCGRFWLWYLIGTIIFLAIFLPCL
jgi:hypothetical protein